MKKLLILLSILFSSILLSSTAEAAIIVGRISHVEGQIYRYMDVDDSWVATFLQSPVGTEDILSTGNDSRAEIAFPNDQLIRLDENSELEVLNLDEDIGEFALHSGLARFYNRDMAGKLLVETAKGTLKVGPGSIIDLETSSESVTVFAVRGEGTFFSYQAGEERMEVISGSTRLEFSNQAVAAARGPIDRNWDRWCVDRENIWDKNHLVRSEHLPDTMQEYAYTLEPYGRWQKVYYRGYYYWAWRPHSVSVGWSPYTSGYWYDWHESPVWIDHNPWGWVTHHHGHWLNLHGAWLWTPYVHVSHVSGVTAIGFNIIFGKRYRSHWHPGRVRWITHNDHVGWLPLTPWETYYGYRKWGPRSVVIGGGIGISININLSSHRHIDHAVVIPKRHLYHRKPGVINNYNTVKIRNINKTVIVNDYKPLTTAERQRERRHHEARAIRTRDSARTIEIRRSRNMERTRETVRKENRENYGERVVVRRTRTAEKTNVTGNFDKKKRQIAERRFSGAVENHRAGELERERRKRVARTETGFRRKAVEKKENTLSQGRVTTRATERKSVTRTERAVNKGKGSRPAQVEASRERTVKHKRKIFEAQENRVETKRQGRRDSISLSQKQEHHLQQPDTRAERENSRNSRAREERREDKREWQTAKNTTDEREKSVSVWQNREKRRRPDSKWFSSTFKGRSIR